jgi:2-polyprenyl-3-methyl-5-hydroxy-6-metoxy-1,4-benzoquinol methylase
MQIEFNGLYSRKETIKEKEIYFFSEAQENIDQKTVDSFGEEWEAFSSFSDEEICIAGDQYFDIISPEMIEGKTALDVGCGSGRWTRYVASKAAFVDAIDPSKAVYSAAHMLQYIPNTRISQAGVDNIPFANNSFDFVFSLGVLHHIPNTQKAMQSCVEKLKSGGHFLVYLYYDFEQRGFFFKLLFQLSNLLRFFISKLPATLKKWVCNGIAIFVYAPLVMFSKCIAALGMRSLAHKMPLSYYRAHSFHIMKNDALDRFGTPLEQRFSRAKIREMMELCGLESIIISEGEPYWHAVGRKK